MAKKRVIDMDIFNLINKDGNDCFKDFNENDLQELINKLEEYYLTLRDKLGLGYETTFGFEIEFEDAMKEVPWKQWRTERKRDRVCEWCQ